MKKTDIIGWVCAGLFFFSCLVVTAHAAEKPAGKILRLTGQVKIDRLGKTISGAPELNIVPLDIITTGPDSMVELLFRDGSSIHMGPDSRFEVDRYVFDLKENNPSFLAKMAKGLFVYISGAISKVHPGAVKFETPESTIGIRGTKLVVKIESISTDSQPGSRERTIAVLFRDNTGHVGKVIISNRYGSQILDKAFYAVIVNFGQAPSEPVFMDRKTLEKMFPEFLYSVIFENYSPPLPYTQSVLLWEEISRLTVQPPGNPDPVSVTSP